MKKLTRHGNSLALVIEKPILDLLGIDAQTPSDISTDGDMLVVRPRRSAKERRRIVEALGWVNKHYGQALRRLAE